VFIPWHLQAVYQEKKGEIVEGETPNKTAEKKKGKNPNEEFTVYQRYYHLFKKGELEDLFQQIDGAQILQSSWDHDNWYIIVQKP
jgi:tRNA (uracil-5-)-methyltransferase TRM9